jgi:hypothetical protein
MRCGKKDDQEENKGECCAKITRCVKSKDESIVVFV